MKRTGIKILTIETYLNLTVNTNIMKKSKKKRHHANILKLNMYKITLIIIFVSFFLSLRDPLIQTTFSFSFSSLLFLFLLRITKDLHKIPPRDHDRAEPHKIPRAKFPLRYRRNLNHLDPWSMKPCPYPISGSTAQEIDKLFGSLDFVGWKH